MVGTVGEAFGAKHCPKAVGKVTQPRNLRPYLSDAAFCLSSGTMEPLRQNDRVFGWRGGA